MEVLINALSKQQAHLFMSLLKMKFGEKSLDPEETQLEATRQVNTGSFSESEEQEHSDLEETPDKELEPEETEMSRTESSKPNGKGLCKSPKYSYKDLFSTKQKNSKSSEAHSYCHVSSFAVYSTFCSCRWCFSVEICQ